MNPPADKGRLQDTDLPELLASICGSRRTGTLRVSRTDIRKTIFIQNGRIVFASSENPDDRLGELLLRKGLLRIQHFEEASARMREGKRLGALLVEQGHLRSEELVKAVIEQVKEIVFDVFLWSDGDYIFEPGDLPTREVITLKLSTPEVILGGIQRIHRWSRVIRGVGGLDAFYQSVGGRDSVLHQMSLRTEQSALLQALELPMSVRDLCRRGLLADFEVCRALWAFRVIGLIEPAPLRPAAEAVSLSHPSAAAPAEAHDFAPVVPPPPAAATPQPSAMTMAMPALAPERRAPGAAATAEGDDLPVLEVVDDGGEQSAAPAPRRAGTSRSPATLDEKQVEYLLSTFNERHHRFYSSLVPKAGSKAPEIVGRCLDSMEKDLPGLFSGITPDAEGRFDLDSIKTNIFAFGVLNYATGLHMLLEREAEMTESLFGSAVRRAISQAIKAE